MQDRNAAGHPAAFFFAGLLKADKRYLQLKACLERANALEQPRFHDFTQEQR
jgi:hypothetical protein